jgi:hypothetical protein
VIGVWLSDAKCAHFHPPVLNDFRSMLLQKLLQDRPVAVFLVFTVAADRKVRLARKGSENIKHPAFVWGAHLGPIPASKLFRSI